MGKVAYQTPLERLFRMQIITVHYTGNTERTADCILRPYGNDLVFDACA
jgi:hypothetical protein